MRKQKRRHSVLENVTVGPAVSEGNCIVKTEEGAVVFVKYAAPGDVVDLNVWRKKKNYSEGQITAMHAPSPLRIEPFCMHFTVCGGCKWQHMPYPEQLAFKQQQVIDALERIGGISDFEVLPILGSQKTIQYRNKLELTFSNKAWVQVPDHDNPEYIDALGFHVPGRFDKVLDMKECFLMPDPLRALFLSVKDFCVTQGYTFFDIREQHGFLRNLLLRCNSRGEWMVLLSVFTEEKEQIDAILSFIENNFPQVISLLYVINYKKNDTLQDLEIRTWKGDPFIMEKLGDLEFKIRPQSFFQTNTAQAETLYDVTKEFAALSGDELVYDLYTGTGSIALSVAASARQVIGIEYVPEAIADAHDNMGINNISNTEFHAGDMKDILTADFFARKGAPDLIITDPPREGMHADVVERILESGCPRIVYVSCNPATQARDAQLLSEKYKLVKIRPVDMFPHTHHVENVALFELI